MEPIRIISWKSDFIAALADLLAASQGADMSRALVVFPHGRPARYLRKALAERPDVPRPCLPPDIRSMDDLMEQLTAWTLPANAPSLRQASELDRAGLLMDLVPTLAQHSSGLLSKLPADPDRFLPWGLRLAALFEELLRHDLPAVRMPHMEGEVADEAAALLAELDVLYDAYLTALKEQGLTTPGLELRRLLTRLPEVAERLADRRILLAGFHAPSGGHDKLLRFLWAEAGAEVYWHTDPGLVDPGVPDHPCAAEHRAWQRRWRARLELVDAPEHPRPEVRIYEAFDFHSQLKALETELAGGDLSSTAVVLPDTGRLMPVLHHLPDVPVNVSMGYPLARTPTAQLLETIMALQEGRSESGYYWRDMQRLVRSPLLRAFKTDPDAASPMPVLSRVWAEKLAQGERFAPVRANLPDPGLSEAPGAAGLLDEILAVFITGFEDLSTLEQLARAMERALELLHLRADVEASRPLDAECIHRLRTGLPSALAGGQLGRKPFSPRTLFTVFRRLVAEERVAFEPEPLTGLQILGPLEARLLHFKTVIILDATEDKLPGGESFDPLLPDALRHLLSLPDAGHRDMVAAYNIHRLLLGANRAVAVYQAGTQPGVLDSKTVRSRFVEQLLWDMEQEKSAIITPTADGPLRAVRMEFTPYTAKGRDLPATNALASALRRLVARGLSPSAVDRFLRCPKQSLLAGVTGVRESEEPGEEGDAAEFGNLVHELLSDEFTPLVGRSIGPDDLDAEALVDEYNRRLALAPFFKRMPFDLRLGLSKAGGVRLRQMVKNFPATKVLALEQRLRATIDTPCGAVPLFGVLDRLDERDGDILVLDYKTGKAPPKPTAGFWDETEFWSAARETAKEGRIDFGLLSAAADSAPSLQLPLYMVLQAAGGRPAAANAAYVKLAGQSEELPLFPDNADPEDVRRAYQEQTPLLLGLIARHMAETPTYPAREGRHCDFCPYRPACGA